MKTGMKKFAGVITAVMLLLLVFASLGSAAVSIQSTHSAKSISGITYTFLSGKVGTYYNDFVKVTGGYSPFTWTKVSGTLPSGLSMYSSSNYLYLRGTPTRAGTYSFTLRVMDAYGDTDTKSFTLTIASALSIEYTFAGGKVGTYYNDYVKATGGSSPFTWTKTSGTLPTGLSMYSSSNYLYLRGTPTKAGTYSFTLKAKDAYGNTATKSFSLTIAPNPVTITYTFSNGKVGTYYSDYVKPTGGTSPFTWTKTSGLLPPGLSMSSSGDYLYLRGTPTRAGTYSFTLKAKDAYGNTATKSFTMTIASALKIEYTFAGGKVGTYYNDYVKATGGSSPFTWTKTSGTIPNGLSMYRSGNYLYLRGTPTSAGTYSFTLKVKDAQGYTATKSFTMTIAPALKIEYTFAGGKVGTYYNDYVKATGGSSPFTWTKTSGTLPSGLSMYSSGNYLYLRGTPTSAGTYSFTLKVKDAQGYTATQSFTLTIAPALKIEYTFASGKVGTYYNDYVKATGGSSPFTWTKTSGKIPNGLSMYSSGNYLYLRGTPTKAGTYSFTLKAKDAYGNTATKSFSLTIAPNPVTITYTFSNGKVGTYYSDYVKPTGGTSPFTWTKTSGLLPPGLSMSSSGDYLYLRGTPTRAGTYSFTLKVKGAYGNTATKSFTMTIASTPVSITYTFTGGKVGTYYNDYVKATGGTSPFTWTKTSGTIPNGLSMYSSGNYLYLRGTPTKAGTYSFTLKVKDTYGYTATKSFSLTIAPNPVTITYTFSNGKVGTYYNDFVKVTGGTSPFTWTKTSGTIPSGLSMYRSSNYLYLRGTPTKAGTYSFTLKVKDKYGYTDTKSFTITISSALKIEYTFSSGKVGTYYNDYVKVTGGTSPFTWTKTSGTIPNGLSMYRSGNFLYLKGTPTKAGTYSFTLKVKDTYGNTTTKSFTMIIAANPVSITYTFLSGRVGTYYNDFVKATGGTSPYTWTKTSGTIPNGLSMYRSGNFLYLRGTPTIEGTYSFTLKVKDKYGYTDTKSFSLTIGSGYYDYATSDTGSASPSQDTTSDTGQADSVGETPQIPSSPTDQTGLAGTGNTAVNLSADLEIVSNDILESYDDRDSDLVKVRENTPVSFTVSNWGANVSDITVYVDDKPVNITVSDEGIFTLPAEMVTGDFKVSAKAQSESGEIESNELYIITE